ncbi:hypothetical protein [Xylanimonas ulmi]|uniref:Holin n=1 Tax=Xylanimonas ulmi TaxID=228973 RepID=A0A4Q7M466_9MICO|nr:hypothetical protein [Xylanibacterium ulmi]RZS61697.1 hypothetical protein EV386_2007 [Xylanibacterium ulmi]
MSTRIVPDDVVLAAKRGFLRTTFQAYAATLTTGLPGAAAIVAFVQDDSPGKWIAAGITIALALLSPPAAGLASYLSITSKGIPEDYLPPAAVIETIAVGGSIRSGTIGVYPPATASDDTPEAG